MGIFKKIGKLMKGDRKSEIPKPGEWAKFDFKGIGKKPKDKSEISFPNFKGIGTKPKDKSEISFANFKELLNLPSGGIFKKP